jgi:hypothetical protein
MLVLNEVNNDNFLQATLYKYILQYNIAYIYIFIT